MIEKCAHVVERVVFVGGHVVRNTGLGVVCACTAEILKCNILASDCLDDVGSGDEHLRGLIDHDREVSDRRGVDRTARTWPHDQGDLWDDSRGLHIAVEDLAV